MIKVVIYLFLEVLYSTLRIGLHDSFLPSFCIFPAFKTEKHKFYESQCPLDFLRYRIDHFSYVKFTKIKCAKAA